MTPDGVIRVPVCRFRPPPTVDAYALTPEGEEALDASLLWDPAPTAEALAAHPASEWPLTSHLSLLAVPGVVPLARQHARRKLAQWHVRAQVSSDTEAVQLIISELVTNAIRAYPGEAQPVPSVRLWLSAGAASVLVQVWDASDSMPVLLEPDSDAAGGRGLVIVEALSKDWGAYRRAALRGKIVWAIVDTRPASPPVEHYLPPPLLFVR